MIESIKKSLAQHAPADLREAAHKELAMTVLENVARPLDAGNYSPGHIVVGAVALSHESKITMIHHAKLNRWFQPGGHVEPCDESLAHAAARELREECDLEVDARHGVLVDVDVHLIPPGKGPAHIHIDFRFLWQGVGGLAQAGHGVRKTEQRAVQTLLSEPDTGLARLGTKLVQLLRE